ncbi:hypothetical protein [Tenacibaculum discolor]|uniref:hypothetical protein n=1 Tax=Tenacibaculum discolor TaxID=361581 RepID=UPI003F7A08C7
MKKTIFTIAMLAIGLNAKAQSVITETSEGKVGIGTTTPKGKLDLGGKVGAENGLKVGDYIELNERETIHNAGLISFNAVIDKNDVSKFRPIWTGSSTASGIVMSMNSGGVSDLTFYGYKWGTNATPRSLDEFTKLFHIGTNGNIGVGTTTPNTKLEIYHNSKRTVEVNPQNQLDVTGNSSLTIKEFVPSIEFHDSSTSSASAVTFANNNKFYIGKKTGTSLSSSSLFNVDLNNGNVGIGTTTTGSHKLAVEGSIGAREIKVEAVGWPDYVFSKEYLLPTLQEVEKHINEKGHLQNIPSAEEVKKNGFFLGEMDAKLLQKIEELTLYTIQQEKQLKRQTEEIEELKILVKKLMKFKE